MAERRIRTPQNLGAVIRDERSARSLTQAQLALAADVSREWLIGVEQGTRPRAELTKVLSVLAALDLSLIAGSCTGADGAAFASEAPSAEGRLTDDVTAQAIAAMREARRSPTVSDHGDRAARLLRTGMDPGLAAVLTRTSMALARPSENEGTEESAPDPESSEVEQDAL